MSTHGGRYYKIRSDKEPGTRGYYGYIILDSWGEAKPVKVVTKRDAEACLARLNRMDGREARAAKRSFKGFP